MTFAFNFGRVSTGRPAAQVRDDEVCRIVLMGDFSGRAHRGERRSSDELAQCKAQRLDPDTLDALIASFATQLRIPLAEGSAAGAGTVEFRAASLDDLHPDALYDQLPVFGELARLRQRLNNPATSVAAAQEVRQWGAAAGLALPPPPEPRGRGDALRIDAELADFARLLGFAPTPAPKPSPLDAMLREVMAPHIVPASAPDAKALTALVDTALSATMKALLHHPDFQCLEAAWRSLDFIVRRCECDETLKLQVYDISAEEFAADLSATDSLEATGLYRLLVERPAHDARLGPPSALVGLYGFEMTPAHAELLGRIAAIAAKARAPFIASVGADVIGLDEQTLPPRTVEAWAALRGLPQARFVGLTTPRFLLRAPYGRRTEAIERFAFEECASQGAGPDLLWGHSSLLAAALLGRHAREAGLGEAPGAQLDLDDMAGYVETDADGDTVAFRSTEQLLNERQVTQLLGADWMPVMAHKARPQVRLGGFGAITGDPLAGPWSTQDVQR